MSSELPFVSIVIPTRPGQTNILALTAVHALDYPRERLEIIVARGQQPAVQRNRAIRAVRGEIIYFLDDDAQPLPDNLRRACQHFSRAEVQMVGGPNVCPPEAPPLEQLFAVVLSSWLAFGPSRARYAAVGSVRETSEKELILCNLAARRDALVTLGGFNEALYPNEENAMMDELQRQAARLVYDPQFLVHRRPRPTVKAFFKMLLTYGRGRAEQFRVHPTWGSALNFVPPLFVLYLVLLPVVNSTVFTSRMEAYANPGLIWLGVNLPLLAYVLALLVQAAFSARTHGWVRAVSAVPLVYCSHILYGLGFWHGLFTRLKPPPNQPETEVTLDHLPV